MIHKARRTQILMGILALTLLFGVTTVDAKMVPKIDNFIYLVDQSGSMYMRHQECGEIRKMALAKQLLFAMNELIPELGYKGSLYLFAPFQPIVTPEVYSRAKFAAGIKQIKDDQEIFGRLTPMGLDIDSLDAVLASLPGKTAIIVISDGWSNIGPDPVGEARKLYAKYPNICIHVVALADRKEGKETLTALNKLNGCSIYANGCALLKDGLPQWVRDVFYDETAEAASMMKESMILRGIHFDFNKYDIKPEWAVVLDEAASTLRAQPSIDVVVEGHTDGVGSVPYNQVLSEKRAAAVKKYLIKKGVSPMRINSEGFGKLKPIADNNTDEGRAMNRRVEIKVQ